MTPQELKNRLNRNNLVDYWSKHHGIDPHYYGVTPLDKFSSGSATSKGADCYA